MAIADQSEWTSKVLIIDDMLTNVMLMEAMTSQLPGVEAVGFTRPIEALIWCESNEPDLILLDQIMPEIGGPEMLTRLKALPSIANTPVIVVTAMEDRQARLTALDSGASDFIIKPLDPAEFLVRCRNMLNLAKATRLLQRLATTDELTGLWNRRHFLTRLGIETDRANRFPGRALSAAVLDIDDFKQINDQYGHAAGDMVLRQIARIAGDSVRTIDVVGRIGGEEFAIILPDTDLAGAGVLCERLRQRIEDYPIVSGTRELKVTVSGGLAEFTLGERSERLLARADEGLYRAKRAGKNRIVH